MNLQRQNARLSQLIANLEGGVLVEDETRHIVLVNPAFCDMFGIPAAPETLIGTDCSGSAEASKAMFADPEGFVAQINTILRNRMIVNGEHLHLKDGRIFARDYIPIFATSEYIGHLWHYHDITEAYQSRARSQRLLRFEEVNRDIIRLFLQLDDMDEALNQSLAMTGELLDVSRVYVFRIRDNARILNNTHEWCAPGVLPEIDNLQELPFDELFPSFFPLIAQHDRIAPRHINELPDDLRGVLDPQDIQTVLWMPLKMDGRIEGFIGYDETRQAREWLPEEITLARIIAESYARALERDQATRMLIETRDEAVRTAQLRAQFVANMSHEIRTPLTGIMGMLELLTETGLDELQHDFVHDALTSSSRLLTIVNDILDFSKLEAGQVVLESTPIDLKAIATEIKMTLATHIKEKPLEIRLNIDPAVPYRVYGDATRIRQVLMNLVGNALKFTHSGHIILSIHLVHAEQQTAYLRFAVEDTGIGIFPEQLEHIFESFIQADGSTTRKYGGSGLGLSISKQLVELMGGEIAVKSEPHSGSVFSFTLRMLVAQASSIQELNETTFNNLHVLLVDHNRTARYVLAQQLEAWGVRVTQVHDISERDAIQPPFDVIFQRYQPGEAHPEFTQNTVYIVDEPPLDMEEDAVYLQWPIDRSSLYNLLIAFSYLSDTPLPDTPQQIFSKGRVLLADDYPLNIQLVKWALSKIQIQVDFVENGQAVLDRLEQVSYDLILMDIQMPVMSGIEATRRIRQSTAAYRSIPIIALTASVMKDEQERYLAQGVNAILAKPYSIKELREITQRWLQVT